ncbi:CLUMA_CG018220, isoform A [Clunio marinus]|uniref:CLUMA_CG018220, isoform A n=1 Tax=Clunio marinus TaxID=568069 RepID=A0A1J1J3N2_9DIPT|nr:CLUMA_CG018220, isoform A [Clunio marinus]
MSRLIKIFIMTAIALMCLSIFIVQTEAIPLEISSETEGALEVTESTTKFSQCSLNNPCGWAVYGNSKTKKTQYYIRNTCLCKKEHSCLRTNEDLSLSAYVYRCKVKNPIPDA